MVKYLSLKKRKRKEFAKNMNTHVNFVIEHLADQIIYYNMNSRM